MMPLRIHCAGKTVDVADVYARMGHVRWPPLITLSGAQLCAEFDVPNHHQLFLESMPRDRYIHGTEAVILEDGLRFYSCPPTLGA